MERVIELIWCRWKLPRDVVCSLVGICLLVGFLAGPGCSDSKDPNVVTNEEYAVYGAVLELLRSDPHPNFDSLRMLGLILSGTGSSSSDSLVSHTRACDAYPTTKGQKSECMIGARTTTERINEGTKLAFREYSFTLDGELIDSFNTINEVACLLDSSMFPVNLQARLFSKEKDEEYEIRGGRFYDHYYEDYPCADGLRSLSRVGFSKDGNVALVLHGIGFGRTAGTGHYFLLRNVNGHWQVVDKLMTWIS